MNKTWQIVVAAVAVLVVAGCAQNPQTVRLAPETPDQYAVDYGEGRPVALRVEDNRLDPSKLGELKNREEPPAPVRSKQDLAYVVQLAAGESLKAYGFEPVAWDADAERRLTVSIDKLDHQVGSAVPRKIETSIRLSATAAHEQKTLKLNAERTANDRLTHRPSASENARYIDEIITQGLSRIIKDDMARFLAEGETGG